MEATTNAKTLATYMTRDHIIAANERKAGTYSPVRTKAGAKVHMDGQCGIWAAKAIPASDYAAIPATSLCNKCFGFYGAK